MIANSTLTYCVASKKLIVFYTQTNLSVKQFILDHQITAAGWYVGVPHLTIQDIRRQDRIVKGINKALDEAQS